MAISKLRPMHLLLGSHPLNVCSIELGHPLTYPLILINHLIFLVILSTLVQSMQFPNACTSWTPKGNGHHVNMVCILYSSNRLNNWCESAEVVKLGKKRQLIDSSLYVYNATIRVENFMRLCTYSSSLVHQILCFPFSFIALTSNNGYHFPIKGNLCQA